MNLQVGQSNFVPISDQSNTRRVIFVLLPNVNLLDLGGPAQVFDVAKHFGAPYELHFCGPVSQILSIQGLPLGPLEPLPEPRSDDLVVIPGPRLEEPIPGQPWIERSKRIPVRRSATSSAPKFSSKPATFEV